MGCGSGRPLSAASAFPAAAPAALGLQCLGCFHARFILLMPHSAERVESASRRPPRSFGGSASTTAAGVDPGERISRHEFALPSGPGLGAHARPRRTPSDSRRRAVSRSGAVEPLRAPRPHALKAQTAQDRTPVCGQNPKEPRRRAAGAPGTPNRQFGESARRPQGHGAERRGLPPRLRAAARGGSSAGISRNGSPPPRPAGSDVRSRPPGRAEHDSRLPSPAPPIRFTTD